MYCSNRVGTGTNEQDAIKIQETQKCRAAKQIPARKKWGASVDQEEADLSDNVVVFGFLFVLEEGPTNVRSVTNAVNGQLLSVTFMNADRYVQPLPPRKEHKTHSSFSYPSTWTLIEALLLLVLLLVFDWAMHKSIVKVSHLHITRNPIELFVQLMTEA